MNLVRFRMDHMSAMKLNSGIQIVDGILIDPVLGGIPLKNPESYQVKPNGLRNPSPLKSMLKSDHTPPLLESDKER